MKKTHLLLTALLSFCVLLSSCTIVSSSSKEPSSSQEEITFCTVMFYDKDGNLIDSSQIVTGSTAVYHGDTKYISDYRDETYVYVFKGWDKPLENIQENTDFHPVFEREYREYSVKFYDYDGLTMLKEQFFHYNDQITYTGDTPSRESDEQYTAYQFLGWKSRTGFDDTIYDFENVKYTITQSVNFIAQYEKHRTHYVVTFKNGDDVLEEKAIPVGEAATYTKERPTKEGPEGIYSFNGWEPALTEEPITEDTTYVAKFTLKKHKYTVTFYDDDRETVLFTIQVEYGDPYYGKDGVNKPTKESDSIEYNYVFAGWDYGGELRVTSDRSIYATYHQEYIQWHIEFRANGGYWGENSTVSKSTKSEDAINGRTISTPAVPSYDNGVSMTFLGYNTSPTVKEGDELLAANEEITATKDAIYYAIWEEGKGPNKGVTYTYSGFYNSTSPNYGMYAASHDGSNFKKYAIKSAMGTFKHTDGKFYSSYVTSIDDYGWFENTKVEAIYIIESDYFKKIGKYAFQNCSNLKEITLPSKLQTVGASAFKGTNLPYLILPSTVTYVGDSLIGKTIYFKCTSVDKLPLTASIFSNGSDVKYNTRYSNFAIYSENQPVDTSVKYWHYNDNNEPVIWA